MKQLRILQTRRGGRHRAKPKHHSSNSNRNSNNRNNSSNNKLLLIAPLGVLAGSFVLVWIVLQSSRASLDASLVAKAMDSLHFQSAPSAKALWTIQSTTNTNTNSNTNSDNNHSTTASASTSTSVSISTPTVSISTPAVPTSTSTSTSTSKPKGQLQRLALPKSNEYYDALRIASVTKSHNEWKAYSETTGNNDNDNKHRLILYRSCCGLGHRLVRQSYSYRYTRDKKAPHLWVQWSKHRIQYNCGMKLDYSSIDLFEYYFGAGPMVVVPEENDPDLDDYRVDNVDSWDVDAIHRRLEAGASDALAAANVNVSVAEFDATRLRVFSNHKNFEALVRQQNVVWHRNGPPHYGRSCFKNQKEQQALDHAISDDLFYRQLTGSFRFHDRIQAFANEHRFSERLVLGIHVRAGNGETGDFEKKKRGIRDLDSWVTTVAETMDRLVQTIQSAQRNNDNNNNNDHGSTSFSSSTRSSSLPPLLFVATDDGSVIGKLADATRPSNIEVVSLPQQRMEPGSGVNYNARVEQDACFENWFSQIADAILLGAVDVVVAARYSSFTQSLPLVSVLSGSIRDRKQQRNQQRKQQRQQQQQQQQETPAADATTATNDDDDTTTTTRFAHRLFCESSEHGHGLQCYDDYVDWMMDRNQLYVPATSSKLFADEKERGKDHEKQLMAPC